MRYLITGDTHGRVVERLEKINSDPADTAFIILGDAGFNFYLDSRDSKLKKAVNSMGYTIYCVRGNHEERPQNLSTILPTYDTEISGYIYYEPEFPNIKYLIDCNAYCFNGHKTLVIGGAYSVDKYYRLSQYPDGYKGWTGWFEEEQLTKEEMCVADELYKGRKFDFILSHTCPLSWEPADLFLSFVDQSTVDNSMEKWLDKFKDTLTWNVWCWGHYHADRIERPHCEMFYRDVEDMETVWNRWNGEKTFKKEWWLQRSPDFYFDDNPWYKEVEHE